MAKTKADLLEQAQNRGIVADGVDEADFTVAQLEGLLSDDVPAWEGSLSSSEPLVGPDGHVHLSQEDIDARQ